MPKVPKVNVCAFSARYLFVMTITNHAEVIPANAVVRQAVGKPLDFARDKLRASA
jgi:hypothetical protein